MGEVLNINLNKEDSGNIIRGQEEKIKYLEGFIGDATVKEITDLRTSVGSLNTKVIDLEKEKAVLSVYKEQCDKKDKNIEELTKDNKELNQKIENYVRRNKQTITEKNNALTDVYYAKKEKERVENKNKELEVKNVTLQQTYDDMMIQFDVINKKLDDAKLREEEQKKLIEELKQELKSTPDVINKIYDLVVGLVSNCNNIEEAKEDLKIARDEVLEEVNTKNNKEDITSEQRRTVIKRALELLHSGLSNKDVAALLVEEKAPGFVGKSEGAAKVKMSTLKNCKQWNEVCKDLGFMYLMKQEVVNKN